MTLHQINLVYFSPTKTTAKILNAIAEGYQADDVRTINLTMSTERTNREITLNEGLTVIGAPTYAGRLPLLVVDAFQKLKSDGKPAVIVVLYGNREYEDALLELKESAVQAGFCPIAGGAFIGEHSFATDTYPIAMGRPDGKDLEKARAFGKKIKETLKTFDHPDCVPALEVPGNSPYKKRKSNMPMVPVTLGPPCSLCHTCEESCPTGAIKVSATVETDPRLCIACCACVKYCPGNARVMNNPQNINITAFLSKTCGGRKEPVTFLST